MKKLGILFFINTIGLLLIGFGLSQLSILGGLLGFHLYVHTCILLNAELK